jgi:ER-bound oxygenase mpaB/B'/Rubber oxygenase, catalytic domain
MSKSPSESVPFLTTSAHVWDIASNAEQPMWGFESTNLASTRFPSDERLWPRGSQKRLLFGQALLYHEYDIAAKPNGNNEESGAGGTHGGGGRFLNEATLESIYRHQGDPPVDHLLEILHQEGRPVGDADDLLSLAASAAVAKSTKTGVSSSLSSSSQQFAAGDEALLALVRHVSSVPSWVNEAQVQRGQTIFSAYAPAISAALFYRSLVPGFSIPKIGAVLQATAYLAPPATAAHVTRRLVDTGAFVAAMATTNANSSSNDSTIDPAIASLCAAESHFFPAWTVALQVRVLHAKVRRRLLQRGGQHSHRLHDNGNGSTCLTTGPRYGSSGGGAGNAAWDVPAYGIPINQEDLAATLLGFSYNAMLGCEMILGRPWHESERLDFLAFWRYVGWLLGVPVVVWNDAEAASNDTFKANQDGQHVLPALDPCGPGWYPNNPDPLAHSYAMFGSMLLHLSKPDASSVEIAHHLLRLGKAPNFHPLYDPSLKRASTPSSKKNDSGQNRQESKDNNEWWFYFRCYQCRRYAGNELGDALRLPYHPVWHRRWQIHVLSTCYLWILRLYSWAAWPTSPFRNWIVQFHERQFRNLLVKWQTGHSKASNDAATGTPSCPFAMVRPPRY